MGRMGFFLCKTSFRGRMEGLVTMGENTEDILLASIC